MFLPILLIGVFVFAYVVLNGGEHRMHRPGIARPLTIVLIVLLAALLWPIYGQYVAWMMPR